MKLISSIILLIFLISSVQAQTEQKPFDVSYVLLVPHLSPGDSNIGIEFTLQNNNDISINNAKITLFIRYPFSGSISPNNKMGELSYPGYLIASGGSGNEYTPYFSMSPRSSHKTTFKIDVDRNAQYGVYDLPYTIDYGDNNQYSGKITLSVKGDTLIEIKKVSVDNSKIEPGEIFKISVLLENVGDNEIKWLRLSLNPKDKELVPITSGSERILKDIVPGSTNESVFWFSLEKDATVRNYPIDLILNYMDERGVNYNETNLAGIVAAGRGGLDIAKKTTDPSRILEDKPFVLTVKIENTGTGDAKGVSARLESDLTGDTLAYLGEIKKDDYSNAVFTMDGAKSGKRTGILKMTYEDDFGKHEVDKDIIIIIAPNEGASPLPLIAGIIIVLVLLIVWKRRKT